jgi:hypothetical protein
VVQRTETSVYRVHRLLRVRIPREEKCNGAGNSRETGDRVSNSSLQIRCKTSALHSVLTCSLYPLTPEHIGSPQSAEDEKSIARVANFVSFVYTNARTPPGIKCAPESVTAARVAIVYGVLKHKFGQKDTARAAGPEVNVKEVMFKRELTTSFWRRYLREV